MKTISLEKSKILLLKSEFSLEMSEISRGNFTLNPMGTDQLFLNQISTLIFGWEIVDFETMINQKSTSRPQFNQLSTKFQPFFNIDISTSNLVDFWLNCSWEVDFWLITVSKSMISQKNINVEDGWGKLRLNVESTLIQRWDVDLYPLGKSRWRHQGGTFPPPRRKALPPTCTPRQKKKMSKISHHRQIFGFLSPQNRILPPRCPPQKCLVPPL